MQEGAKCSLVLATRKINLPERAICTCRLIKVVISLEQQHSVLNQRQGERRIALCVVLHGKVLDRSCTLLSDESAHVGIVIQQRSESLQRVGLEIRHAAPTGQRVSPEKMAKLLQGNVLWFALNQTAATQHVAVVEPLRHIVCLADTLAGHINLAHGSVCEPKIIVIRTADDVQLAAGVVEQREVVFADGLGIFGYALQNAQCSVTLSKEQLAVAHTLRYLHRQHMCRKLQELVTRASSDVRQHLQRAVEIHLLIGNKRFVDLCFLAPRRVMRRMTKCLVGKIGRAVDIHVTQLVRPHVARVGCITFSIASRLRRTR